MKVYVVVADTYIEDRLGSSIELFGVYSNEKDANKRLNKIQKEYLNDEDKEPFVKEVMLDEDCQHYLGGYIE